MEQTAGDRGNLRCAALLLALCWYTCRLHAQPQRLPIAAVADPAAPPRRVSSFTNSRGLQPPIASLNVGSSEGQVSTTSRQHHGGQPGPALDRQEEEEELRLAPPLTPPAASSPSSSSLRAPDDDAAGGEGGTEPEEFLFGANLGNLNIFPFSRALVSHTPQELKAMILSALDELAGSGANLLRVWLHIDGAINPQWGASGGASQARNTTRSPGGKRSLLLQQEGGVDGDGGGAVDGTGGVNGTGGAVDERGAADSEGVAEVAEVGEEGPSDINDSEDEHRQQVVVGCGEEVVADLKWLLRACHARRMRVLLVLWSHDVLAVRKYNPPSNRQRALNMLTTAHGTQAYIDTCLTPLVTHLASTSIYNPTTITTAATSTAGVAGDSRTAAAVASVPADTAHTAAAEPSTEALMPPFAEARDNTVVISMQESDQQQQQQQQQQQDEGPGSSTAVARYGDVIYAYEVLNEPEGMAWELRMYHTYMYRTQYGKYNSYDVGKYNAQYKAEHRNLSVLYKLGGRHGGPSGDPKVAGGAADYVGWYFIAGSKQIIMAEGGATAEGDDGSARLRCASPGASGWNASAADALFYRASDTHPQWQQQSTVSLPWPPNRPLPSIIKPIVPPSPAAAAAAAAAAVPMPPAALPVPAVDAGELRPLPLQPPLPLPRPSSRQPPALTGRPAVPRRPTLSLIPKSNPASEAPPPPPTTTTPGTAQTVSEAGAAPGEDASAIASATANPKTAVSGNDAGGSSDVAGRRGGRRLMAGAAPAADPVGRSSTAEPSAAGPATAGPAMQHMTGAADAADVSAPDATVQAPRTLRLVQTHASLPPTSGVGMLTPSVSTAAIPEAAATSNSMSSLQRPVADTSTDMETASADAATAASRRSMWEHAASRMAFTAPSASVAPTGHGSGSGGGSGTMPSGAWFNSIMYVDVFAKHNSELTYLLPLVASCTLRSAEVPLRAMQRFVSRAAAAIHAADPHARVTVGSHSLPYITDANWLKGRIGDFEQRPRNLFSDAALKAAFEGRDGEDDDIGGGFEPRGTLDLYAPHGYPYWGHKDITQLTSPFYMAAQRLQLDKPALIGEMWTKVEDNTNLNASSFRDLKLNGYAGGLVWAYFEVKEEPGGRLDSTRTIVKHEQQAYYMPALNGIHAALQSKTPP